VALGAEIDEAGEVTGAIAGVHGEAVRLHVGRNARQNIPKCQDKV
jgi:hypothetical protein